MNNPSNSKVGPFFMALAVGLSLAGCGAAQDTGDGPDDRAGDADAEGDVDAAELAVSGACAHDKCTQGAALDPSCSPAAASICAVDPYCCNVSWDGLCVYEVQTVTNSLVCTASQGTCDHTLCATGNALDPRCDAPPASSSCVESICAVDPYCCSVSWDGLCAYEVQSVCEKSCDATGCDLDGDGDPSPACGGGDGDDTCTVEEGDLQATECAVDLIGYMDGLIGAINAIPQPLATRTSADLLTCPADSGVGESSHVNIFSYVAPLDRSCSRIYEDDCADPARLDYWLTVVDDRRPAVYDSFPYHFQLIWGGAPLNYSYYGACHPSGLDNPAAGIPRMLQPVSDANGDGAITGCAENHVTMIQFYVPEADGSRTYIAKGNIAHISSPFVIDAAVMIPGTDPADHPLSHKSGYMAVDIELREPAGHVITALVQSNIDHIGSPLWVKWKEPASCGAP